MERTFEKKTTKELMEMSANKVGSYLYEDVIPEEWHAKEDGDVDYAYDLHSYGEHVTGIMMYLYNKENGEELGDVCRYVY